MNLSGRPLLDIRSDNELFVDRATELGSVRAALDRGLNCLVVGDRGGGKTSLVRALMFQARQSDDPQDSGLPRLIYVRGAGAQSATELLSRAADVLAEYHGDLPPGGWPGTAAELIRLIGERAQRAPVVMVLDDVASDAGNALFGVLRDELWSIGLRWLVTVATADRGTLLRPPADAFFEAQVELGPLPVEAAKEILRRRIGDVDDRLLEEAAAIGGGNPRRLLDVARDLSGDYSQWSELAAAARERQQALTKAGRSAHMLAAELETLGGASASDEQLLTRMGWTRARAVQVLAELEKADLVTSSSVKSGQGRPKKVYKVVSPTEFRQRRLDDQRRPG